MKSFCTIRPFNKLCECTKQRVDTQRCCDWLIFLFNDLFANQIWLIIMYGYGETFNEAYTLGESRIKTASLTKMIIFD